MDNRKKVIVGASIIFFVMCCFFSILVLLPSTPKVEQLKEDFIIEELDSDAYRVTEFLVEAETESEDSIYEAIITVRYDDEEVEFIESYKVAYKKYDEWILEDIEKYEKDTWTKKPLVGPSVDEFKKKCINELVLDYQFTEYDKIKFSEEKTQIDLEAGIAKFIFEVENNAELQSAKGDLEFEIEFDEKTGKWFLEYYNYSDTFVIEHDLKQQWTGKGRNSGSLAFEGTEKEFNFKIIEHDDKFAKGILRYDGNEYEVFGNIMLPEEVGEDIRLDLINIEKQKRIEGKITIAGTMNVTVDTAYKPNYGLYYPKDRYGVELQIAE